MADEITDDELHALIAAAKTGKEASDSGGDAFGQAALSYDFKRPQRVNKDQMRRLEGIHEQFCRMVASTLSSSMRMVVDIDLAFSDQLLYNEFILSLPNPSAAYSFTLEPLGGRGIISFAPELLMAVIDRAFGGQGRSLGMADARSLTQIELNVVNKVVTRVLGDLENTWEPVADLQVTDVLLEMNPEFIQIAAPGDGVLVVAFEANSKNATGMIHLCYPMATLDPLLGRLSPTGFAGRRRKDPESGEKQRQLLSKTKVPVHVEVARGALPLTEVAGLRVGDVVRLDTEKDDEAVVFIGQRAKYLGRPGLQGKKRAVQIVREIAPDEEDRYR